MILAINANAAVDNVIFIPRFTPGQTMRPQRVVTSVGGKALDSAVALRAQGAPVRAVSFAAGRNGQILADLLQERDIQADWVWVAGETRVSNVIVETDFNRHSHITTPGYTVSPQDCAALEDRVGLLAPACAWAVLAGSLPGGAPADLYARLTRLLRAAGVKVLIDCFGPPAREALSAGPDILKMNQAEFSMTFDAFPRDWPGWIEAVRQEMRRWSMRNFVLTCGKDGILAFTPQAVYHAAAPRLQEVNAAGSGDAVSGTLPYRLWLGDPWTEALRWAAAAGAAVVLTEGTAELRPQDVLEIYPRTTVEEISGTQDWSPTL